MKRSEHIAQNFPCKISASFFTTYKDEPKSWGAGLSVETTSISISIFILNPGLLHFSSFVLASLGIGRKPQRFLAKGLFTSTDREDTIDSFFFTLILVVLCNRNIVLWYKFCEIHNSSLFQSAFSSS